jgi:undecaprenyl-diphosphatase
LQEILKAILLGIVQGLTEFLPISSSAHLRIVPSLFGWEDLGAGYTAVIQIGTMAAIVIYFWKDLVKMAISVTSDFKTRRWMENPNSRLFILITIGTIPIMILGYALKDIIDNQFRDIYLIAANMIFFSGVMWAAERYTKKIRNIENLNIVDSVIIGLFQALALVPGTSRSGSTIAGGFLRHLDRESAAKFSFLLSIPAVLISGLYKLYSDRHLLGATGGSMLSVIIATIVSGLVGYASIWMLLRYIKNHSLNIFIIYRILFGILIIILLSTNIIHN